MSSIVPLAPVSASSIVRCTVDPKVGPYRDRSALRSRSRGASSSSSTSSGGCPRAKAVIAVGTATGAPATTSASANDRPASAIVASIAGSATSSARAGPASRAHDGALDAR